MGFTRITPALLALAPWLAAGASGNMERELIADPSFRQGCKLLSPTPGKVVVIGTVRLPGNSADPVWNLAQWHSKFSLTEQALEVLDSAVFRLQNEAKTVIFAPREDPRGQVVMTLNASREYAGKPRQKGEPWPHLLLSQRFVDPPAITDLAAARFTVESRLLKSRQVHAARTTPHLHAAQFQTFFNIQNLNRKSPGYGDFLYFGIPIYDSRRRHTRGFSAPDQAGKFIMTLPSRTFTDKSLQDGKWVRIEKDILPLIRKALATAWKRGFLLDSRNEKDYRISAMNIGWELPGPLDVSVQLRDLSLKITKNSH